MKKCIIIQFMSLFLDLNVITKELTRPFSFYLFITFLLNYLGMLIESMAGKSGAMHGIYQDATPFQFHEDNRAIDYMGAQLA